MTIPCFGLYLWDLRGEKRKLKNSLFKQATKPVNKGKMRITKTIVFVNILFPVFEDFYYFTITY